MQIARSTLCFTIRTLSLSIIQNLYFVYDFVIFYTDCQLYAVFCFYNICVLFIQMYECRLSDSRTMIRLFILGGPYNSYHFWS